jgi:hypothetical protein
VAAKKEKGIKEKKKIKKKHDRAYLLPRTCARTPTLLSHAR